MLPPITAKDGDTNDDGEISFFYWLRVSSIEVVMIMALRQRRNEVEIIIITIIIIIILNSSSRVEMCQH